MICFDDFVLVNFHMLIYVEKTVLECTVLSCLLRIFGILWLCYLYHPKIISSIAVAIVMARLPREKSWAGLILENSFSLAIYQSFCCWLFQIAFEGQCHTEMTWNLREVARSQPFVARKKHDRKKECFSGAPAGPEENSDYRMRLHLLTLYFAGCIALFASRLATQSFCSPETKPSNLHRIPRYGRYAATCFRMTLTTTLEALEARRVGTAYRNGVISVEDTRGCFDIHHLCLRCLVGWLNLLTKHQELGNFLQSVFWVQVVWASVTAKLIGVRSVDVAFGYCVEKSRFMIIITPGSVNYFSSQLSSKDSP